MNELTNKRANQKTTLKIYTKSGDKGETSLFSGKRVPKDNIRIEAYGTVDELNSILGICRALWPPEEIETVLEALQEVLFVLGGDLATPLDASKKIHRVSEEDITHMEEYIDTIEPQLEPLRTFILPSGTPVATHLHLARTVCRRAERIVVRLMELENIGEYPVKFLNRLSDFLFVLARFANKLEAREETKWMPKG